MLKIVTNVNNVVFDHFLQFLKILLEKITLYDIR